MKKWTAFVLAFMLLMSSFSLTAAREPMEEEQDAPGAVFFVSPQGSDANPGTMEAPFATLERARDAIRALKSETGLPEGGVTVYLREGEYRLDHTFELSAQDSGTAESPIVYKAYRDETVRLIGGVNLRSELFVPVTDETVLNRLQPEVRDHVLQVDLAALGITDYGSIEQYGFGLPTINPAPELFYNNEAMTLARWPNDGFVVTGMVDDPGSNPREGDTSRRGAIFEYLDERPETWADLSDVWMYGYWYWDWADGNLQIEWIDPETNRVKTVQPSHYSVRSGQRYYYYNILEELDSPGEWYLDRNTGVLYFYPTAPIEQGSAQLSLLNETMVKLNNVSCTTFSGITFEASRGIGVEISGGTGNRIEKSTFRNLGNFAVKIAGGEQHGVIESKIYNTGVGGIALNGGNRQTLTPAGHYAVNNEIFNYSRLKATYSPAVQLDGVGNIAAHNEIYDAPHMAISFSGNNHVIEYNDIHDVLKSTSDAGAIYTGRNWTTQGNVIRYNYFHDLRGVEGIGQIAVYLDDMASGSLVYGNIIADSNRGMLIGGGRNNIIMNNMMINNENSLQLDDRGLGWAAYHCQPPDGTLYTTLIAMPYQDEPWASRYPHLVNILDDEPCAPKYNAVQLNVLYNSPDMNIAASARNSGTVSNNWLTEEDPGFEDAANGNYALREDAPVFEQLPGFQPIPFDKIGILTAKDRLEALQRELDGYIDAGEVTLPLDQQLSNALRQVAHFLDLDNEKQALHHVNEFLLRLDNGRLQDRVSEPAHEALTRQAEELAAWLSDDPLGSVQLFAPARVLTVGEQMQLWAMGNSVTGRYVDLFGHIQYESLDPAVAAVDENGTVTTLAVGETEIRVTAEIDGVSVSAGIPVKAVAGFLKEVTLTADRTTPVAGETVRLSVSGTMTNGEAADLSGAAVTYASSDEQVATVDANGTVQTISMGAVTLTATVTLDGVTASDSAHLIVYPVEEPELPDLWKLQHYGDTNGLAVYEDGFFHVITDGFDIWGTSDSFTYIYQDIEVTDESGVITLTANVHSLLNTHKDAASGLMFRDGNTADSKHVNFRVLPNGELRFVYRTSDGGSSNYAAGAAVAYPAALKLVKEGDVFTAYVQRNGEWSEVSRVTIDMDSQIMAGVSVFSHADMPTASEISDVTIQFE